MNGCIEGTQPPSLPPFSSPPPGGPGPACLLLQRTQCGHFSGDTDAPCRLPCTMCRSCCSLSLEDFSPLPGWVPSGPSDLGFKRSLFEEAFPDGHMQIRLPSSPLCIITPWLFPSWHFCSQIVVHLYTFCCLFAPAKPEALGGRGPRLLIPCQLPSAHHRACLACSRCSISV